MVIRILVQGKMEQAAFDELAAIADDAKYPESGLRADQKTAESSPYGRVMEDTNRVLQQSANFFLR